MASSGLPQSRFESAIQSEGWLAHASRFPLGFAQAREDPVIDAWVVDQLPPGSQGLMVASGGCNAALLVSMGRFRTLTLVDPVPAQLALSRLKLIWLRDYEPEQRMALLGHLPLAPAARKQALVWECYKHQLPETVFGSMDEVAELGLDHAGRGEALFARLRFVLGREETIAQLLTLTRPGLQRAFLDAHPEFLEALAEALDGVMSQANLAHLFGREVPQNPAKPFARHLFQQLVRALRELPAASNPYLAQVLAGRFLTATALPWLQLGRQPVYTTIQFQQNSMTEALARSRERFDFIHLSNLLDCLDRNQAGALLELAASRLRSGGWIILRQLSAASLLRDPAPGLTWAEKDAWALQARDRSFFYNRLHVGRKA